MKDRKKISKKKAGMPYSKGQLNYIVDDLTHPLIEKNTAFILADQVLHMLVERDPKVSLEKFVRYSLPQLIKKIAEDL